MKDRNSSGSSDNYHAGLCGGTAWNVPGGDLAFRTGAAYTWHDVSTSRNVTFPDFEDSLEGGYSAGTAQVFGELGYGIDADGFAFEPFANLAYVNLHTDGFTEKGNAASFKLVSQSKGDGFDERLLGPFADPRGPRTGMLRDICLRSWCPWRKG